MNMNKASILFLDIYKSIRGDWSGGIINRGKVLRALIPFTGLAGDTKTALRIHFSSMETMWRVDRKHFDGRSWARDCANSYGEIIEDSKFFNNEDYEKQSLMENEDYESWTDRFPVLTAKDLFLNQVIPQLKGKDPDYISMDRQTKGALEVTKMSINTFLGFELVW